MNQFDLIIIGSGPGGYRTAAYASKRGLHVAIVERGHLGGTCLNCGCIPTKSLCHDAEQTMLLRRHGMTDAMAFSNAIARKDAIVEQLRHGVETLLHSPGITLLEGTASFVDAHTITVSGEEYQGTNIIIATGSTSKMPPVEGIDHPSVVDSTRLLSISKQPRRLAIIGTGVIGMEFASVFHGFGSEVTVIEFLKECLPALDGDIAKRLRKHMEKSGITFHMQSMVKRIDDGKVVFERKGQEQEVEADLILVATGRRPQTDGLNLEAAGLTADGKGIVVNADMQTDVPHIYAIGDVNGRQMLAHAATMQGFHAVNHILEERDNIRLEIMPAAVFTSPEVAGVGMTEEQCKIQEEVIDVHKSFYRASGKAMAMEATDGLVKLLSRRETGEIVGCHVLGAQASALVQEISSLMTRGTTVSDLRDMVHIHPTLGELLQDAVI